MLGYLNITEQVTGRPISGGGAPPSPASRWLAAATSTQTLASRAPATEARTPSQERMQSRAGTRTLWCSGGSRRQRPSRGNSPARPGIAPHETARIMRIQWGKVRLSFHRNNHFCIYLVYSKWSIYSIYAMAQGGPCALWGSVDSDPANTGASYWCGDLVAGGGAGNDHQMASGSLSIPLGVTYNTTKPELQHFRDWADARGAVVHAWMNGGVSTKTCFLVCPSHGPPAFCRASIVQFVVCNNINQI